MTDPQEGQRTILLVEDEAVIAMAEERVLQKHGFQVFTASSGERAIQTVRDTGNIDLILMDIDLGNGMDGTEAAKIILSEKDIPVIFLSNNTQEDVVEKTGKVVSYGYVVKDWGNAVLVASVNMAFKLHDAHRELKKREQALKESRQHFAVVFNSSPLGISLTRFSDGLFFDVNEAFLRLLGFERDEIIGNDAISLGIWVDSEDRARMVAALGDPAGIQGFETTFRTKTGDLREVLLAVKVIDVAEERYIMGHTMDITGRKAAEEALRESESKLRALFDGSRDAIVVSKEGIHTFVNPAYVSLSGYESADELIGTPAANLIVPEMRGFIEAMVRKRALGEPLPTFFEITALKKDGTAFPAEASVSTYAVEEERFTVGIVRDITERKAAEKDLRTSRLQLAEAAQLARMAHWEHDEATDEFIFDDAFYALYGTTAELEGGYRMSTQEYLKRFVHPDDLEELGQRINRNRTECYTDEPVQYEHRSIRRDGKVMHILARKRVTRDWEGHVLSSIGVNQDITERREMEEALRESDNRLKVALASSHMGAYQRNMTTGEVFWSPECFEIFGTKDLGTFESFIALLHPEDVQSVMAAIGQVSVDHAAFQTEFRIIRADGMVRWLANAGQGYFDGTGILVRLVGTICDITERKLTTEALRQSEERFRSLFETSKDSILFINQETAQVLGANPAACSLYGYSSGEFLALKIADISAEPEEAEAAMRQSPSDVPVRLHRKKDGTPFPVEVSESCFTEGALRLKTAFVRDITARRKTEEELFMANFGIRSSISADAFCRPGRQDHLRQRFVPQTLGV